MPRGANATNRGARAVRTFAIPLHREPLGCASRAFDWPINGLLIFQQCTEQISEL